ncbi:MAG: ATP-dependent DNA helicase RuvA [Deltaproteobacteria bacterium RBG_13_53_10]|nr:MAG: ATP-dependent DNA helicase RuvA [Deltaproteobacteria bacterium RBG_13_53_10]
MIRYIEGKLLKKEEDRIVVLANGVGYEILLPAIVRQTFNSKRAGEDGEWVKLYIHYHQTERQPKPLLIGFNFEPEKEFFEKFITVEAIGPPTAVKALVLPIPQIAKAIEERDAKALERLKGIGKRTADKIIASLQGKVGKFALMREDEIQAPPEVVDFAKQVEEVLVKDLGHKVTEAQRLVREAMLRNPGMSTPEELFEEVYRGQKKDLL